jgi:Zn-dependent M28 family amino/carboxypeptidase
LRQNRTLPLGVAAALTLALTATTSPAAAVDDVNTQRLRDAVTVGGILAHERVFQRIANNNDGTRASGTRGYTKSAKYVQKSLEEAGYRVRQQEFTFPFFRELAPAVVEQVSPDATTYETGTFQFSGSGEVTGQLVPTNDIMIPPPAEAGTSPSGCEPGSFPAAPQEPAIALIQRGTCDFGVKAMNAQEAGYEAAIIFNEGQEGRTDLIGGGTLGVVLDIPVVDLSFTDGAALYEQVQSGDEVVMSVSTSTESDLDATTTNVIATSRKGDPEKTVVVGAHLDSVVEGAGINDNGSGSATILEVAEEMAESKIKPRQRVRFAFWGAEESGLLGSEHYVASLSNKALGRIVANLNFDMLGSPNYVRFVYDGDGSDTALAGPAGSAQIEDVFTEYFSSQGLASTPSEFNGRSDYGPFIAVGIPAGGLFTGAEGVKTEEQAAEYGGTAGEWYDPCYHQACDDMSNLSTKALHEMGDAVAHAVMTLVKTRTGFFEDGSMRKNARHRVLSFDYAGSHARGFSWRQPLRRVRGRRENSLALEEQPGADT